MTTSYPEGAAMWLVPGAVWKIIFPAVFCLAKAAMEPNATAETVSKMTAGLLDIINGDTRIAQALQCMNGNNCGGNAFTIIVVITDPKNSTVTAAQENTTHFPRISMPITVFGNTTTTTDRYSITVIQPGDTTARGDPTTDKAAPGVSSTAFEEVTKNYHQNVISTASVENPYTIYMTPSDPEGATTPNGDATSDSENAFKSLEDFSMSQYNIPPAENPGSTTLLSTENTINTITGKTVTQSQDNAVAMAITFGNVPEDLPDNIQGNSVSYSACEIIPPWATVLLCLGTAFFIFALVGLLFLLPYCTKFRRVTAALSSSSPRSSV